MEKWICSQRKDARKEENKKKKKEQDKDEKRDEKELTRKEMRPEWSSPQRRSTDMKEGWRQVNYCIFLRVNLLQGSYQAKHFVYWPEERLPGNIIINNTGILYST